MYFRNICGEPLPNRCIFRFCKQFKITFLKHLRIDTGRAVLMAVLVHLIDKEQRQHFDSLVSVPQFLIQMRFNGAANLRPLDDVLIDIADRFSQCDFLGITKFNMFVLRCTVNSGNRIPLIKLTLTGKQK